MCDIVQSTPSERTLAPARVLHQSHTGGDVTMGKQDEKRLKQLKALWDETDHIGSDVQASTLAWFCERAGSVRKFMRAIGAEPGECTITVRGDAPHIKVGDKWLSVPASRVILLKTWRRFDVVVSQVRSLTILGT